MAAKRDVEVFRIPIPEEGIDREIVRFRSACEETKRGIQRTRSNVGKLFGQELAAIFDAHQLLLADRTYIDDIERRIQRDRINVEWAVHESTVALAKRFAKIDDEYLRERGQDLEDVSRQLLRTLQGIAHHEISEVHGEVILVADDLVPSEAIRLGRANVVGFVEESSTELRVEGGIQPQMTGKVTRTGMEANYIVPVRNILPLLPHALTPSSFFGLGMISVGAWYHSDAFIDDVSYGEALEVWSPHW